MCRYAVVARFAAWQGVKVPLVLMQDMLLDDEAGSPSKLINLKKKI